MKTILIMAALAVSIRAETAPVQWLEATLVSQDMQTVQTGTETVKTVFGGVRTYATAGRINTIEVEDGKYRVRWVEQIGLRNQVVILTVGETFKFYMDRGQLVTMDINGRKHRFNLAGKALLSPAPEVAR